MLKKILCASIIGSFSMISANAFANEIDELESLYDLSGDNDNISLEELGDLISGDINIFNEDQSLSVVKNKPVNEKTVSSPIEQLISPQLKQPEKSLTTPSMVDDSDDIFDGVFELESSLTANNQNIASESFLRYIPEGSLIAFKKHFYIPRTKTTFIYSYGKEIIKASRDSFSICYIKFSQSNKPRELMKHRELLISKNITKKATVKEDGKTVYFTTFLVDNPHVNSVKCMSNESDKPLTLSDFDTHFGGNIEIKFPEYEKI